MSNEPLHQEESDKTVVARTPSAPGARSEPSAVTGEVSLSAREPWVEGSFAGPYEIQRRLGLGGMAEVFLAEQTGPAGFRKRVVIKRMLPHLRLDPDGVELFLREARIAAQLAHPNVVQLYELGTQGHEYYIVMEYVDGITAQDLARVAWEAGAPMPVGVAVSIIIDAARGLHHAHELRSDDGVPLGLVHRDISPDNLILTREGVAKVLDFGIARETDCMALTRTGELKGKVPFMSPEQVLGEVLDRRTDLYALGVTFYWLLTGRRPFSGTSEYLVLDAILNAEPPRPIEFNPEIPAALEEIILRALAKKREDRFPTTLAFAQALLPFAAAADAVVAPFVVEMAARKAVGAPLRSSSLPSVPAFASGPKAEDSRLPASEDTRADQDAPREHAEQVDSGVFAAQSASAPQPEPVAQGDPLPGADGSGFEPTTTVLLSRVRRKREKGGAFPRPLSLTLAGGSLLGLAWLAFAPGTRPPTLPAAPGEHTEAPAPQASALPPREGAAGPERADDLRGGEPSEPIPSKAAPTTPERADPAPTRAAGAQAPAPAKTSAAASERQGPAEAGQEELRSLRLHAPASIEWRSRSGQVLARGTAQVELPESVDKLVAFDTQRRNEVWVPVRGDEVRYDRAPKGFLDLRVFPFAEVYVGQERIGVTPFAPVELVAGKYQVRLRHEGQTRVVKVSVPANGTAKVKVNMNEPM